MTGAIGIIAGGGDLPVRLARAFQAAGRPFFMLGLEGFADPEALKPFPHGWTTYGQVNRTVTQLRAHHCTEVTMAGHSRRPDFRALKLDWKGAMLLPRFLASIGKGDDGLLRAVIGLFEQEGFKVVGPHEVLGSLTAPEGLLTRTAPSARDEADIAHAFTVLAAIGQLDIGQAAIVADKVTLAVEAIEGTDAMLARVAALPAYLRGSHEARRGVLVKASKPGQERRADLPAIGPETVRGAAAAGLAGIVIEAGAGLILGAEEVTSAADGAGLFVAARAKPVHE